jgi:recA bacterial DNA recombination protein
MSLPAPALDWQFQLLDLEPSRTRSTPTLVPPPPPVKPGESEALRQIRKALDPSIAAKVRSGAELLRQTVNSDRLSAIPTTLDAVDTLLGGGLQRGKLVELVSRRAAGRFSIAMSALVAATTMGEAAALIDLGDHFDPQLAEANGVDLRRLLWVRPRTVKEAVMSAEMITATGFQLVVVDMGLHPLRGRRAPDAAWVRLARTAETCGTAMLVSSPYPLTGTASEAVLKGTVARAKWIGRGNAPRLLAGIEMTLTLEKHRHLKAGASSKVMFNVQ